MIDSRMSASEAMERLRDGNLHFHLFESEMFDTTGIGDVSPEIRQNTAVDGQRPFAVVITCSDSRVIPECIFTAGIGDLFVIRVAGNIVTPELLGSVEYALGHLGTKLVLVLGHTHCGAVTAAMHGGEGGYIKSITDVIRRAIGDSQDDHQAAVANTEQSISMLMEKLDLRPVQAVSHPYEAAVAGAIYDIETGKVEFL